MDEEEFSKDDISATSSLQQHHRLLFFDILFDTISFLNVASYLRLSETSNVFKCIAEKLPSYPPFRIVPRLVINPRKYYKLVNSCYEISVYKGGYINGVKINSSLPLLPPPIEILGFENISIQFPISSSCPLLYAKNITCFFTNIKHLLCETHSLHIHFEIYDYLCSRIWPLSSTTYRMFTPNNNMSLQIPEYERFLQCLNVLNLQQFSHVRITSIRSLFFSYSARSENFLTELLNSPLLLNIKYLEIQNDIYCHYRIPYLLPLHITSICNWLFYAKGSKALRFLNDYPIWKFICTAPIERFLIPLIKTLLETARCQYSYLIIHPICTHCFDFTLFLENNLLNLYTKKILNFSKSHITISLYDIDKIELFRFYDHLYIRRSPLYNPVEKHIDPENCWRFLNSLSYKKKTLRLCVEEPVPQNIDQQYKENPHNLCNIKIFFKK